MKLEPESVYSLRASSTPAASASEAQKPRQGQDRRQVQHNWNGNLQGATNDSAEYKPAVRIINGYPVEYSCKDDPRENEIDDKGLKDMHLEFDYEMLTAAGATIDESIRSLEWSLLGNVARNLGLHNCNLREQDPSFRDGNKRFLSSINSSAAARSTTTESYVVSLSSLDFDDVDFNTDFCTFLRGSEDEVCTPIAGKMTAQFTGDEAVISNYLLRNIAEELNSTRVRIEDVNEARFVGDRDDLATLAEFRESIDTKNSSTNLALVVGVLAGVVVLGLVLVLARGRRRTEQQQQVVLDDDEHIIPLPTAVPAVIFQNSPPINFQQHISNGIEPLGSGGTKESLPGRLEIEEALERAVDVPMRQQSESRTLFPPVHVHASVIASSQILCQRNGDTANTTSREISHLSPPENKENIFVPPVYAVPINEKDKKERDLIKSKTLQTRRKRRKKKKKQKQRVLKRVSSRNSIDEMETIQEHGDDVGEELDDEDSEFDGSEYSTDDEDEFVFMSNSLQTTLGKGTPEASDRSPKVLPGLREEPRIRPLPPPWI